MTAVQDLNRYREEQENARLRTMFRGRGLEDY